MGSTYLQFTQVTYFDIVECAVNMHNFVVSCIFVVLLCFVQELELAKFNHRFVACAQHYMPMYIEF